METVNETGAERQRHWIMLGLGAAFVACGAAMLAGLTLAAAWCVSLILTLSASLGALRSSGLGPFKPFFIAALVVWLIAFTLMHWLSSGIDELVLGLPPATAASVFILWFAPLLLVTLPYALFFETSVLTVEDIESLRGQADAAEIARLEHQLEDEAGDRS